VHEEDQRDDQDVLEGVYCSMVAKWTQLPARPRLPCFSLIFVRVNLKASSSGNGRAYHLS